ncbi:putative xanthan lyase [Chthoniobacter flavus Ellin428]|uniref:Putative xanthan lyase n=1 Tax=Chthoniobacter flavus Ellin428 TaxID=497964 RepID=B4CWQ8_9BACT|nr:FAD-dependent oxidoreductase [Chthoniobacter flavus]EDY21850.1 putative xanthan lyase [Chthoniobacter flavus Ellin428]TCO95776.1 FAD dependent oxidoreductase [Chthoniobacter flavus]
MRFPFPVGFAAALFFSAVVAHAEDIQADVVIFGGTSAGVAAAVQAHRMGKTVVIAEWTKHLGGLTTGGLGATEISNKAAIGGIAREFYEQIATHYARADAWKWQKPDLQDPKNEKSKDTIAEKNGRPTRWTFEPHVAMDIYTKWLADAKVKVKLGEKLKSVKKEGTHIVEFTTESGNTYRGKMFIDASYEGDLMAKSGVSYHLGREANSDFGETLNGFREKTPTHQFEADVDPYYTPGDPKSGLLPFIQKSATENPGEGDNRIQAYGLRLCMTQVKENMVPCSELKPTIYNEREYELLARYIEALEKAGKPLTGIFMSPTPIPNGKTDTDSNGAISIDLVGDNYGYPLTDYATREGIIHTHLAYTKGLLYFLATSPHVPQHVRDEVNKWGLAKDEFTDNGHLPTQLYVRESRRMISDYVMTEADCRWQRQAMDAVALAASDIESHHCQRIVQNGFVRNEGDVKVPAAAPFPIAYRSIVPKSGQIDNLFVPVCLSASHIACGSVRAEPVLMALGQSAATAASIAIDKKVTVQKVPYGALRSQLDKDQQIVVWTGAVHHEAAPAPEQLDGIVLDDTDAHKTGEWGAGGLTNVPHVGKGYIHDGNGAKGKLSVEWTPEIPIAGYYEIIFHFIPNDGRAHNVPVTVTIKGGESRTLKVNERDQTGHQSLGLFDLPTGRNTSIIVSNAGTDGHVTVDGLQILRVRN